MRYFGIYFDERDVNSAEPASAICEANSVDACMDGIVKYFRNMPSSLDTFISAQIVDKHNNIFVFLTKNDIIVEGKV